MTGRPRCVPGVYDAPHGRCCALSMTATGMRHSAPQPCRSKTRGTYFTCAPHRLAEPAAVELKGRLGKPMVLMTAGWWVRRRDAEAKESA